MHFMLDILQTAFRLLPWPTRTGLRAIGNPTGDSPVLVTCNYDLTVRRLLRELRGRDLWLLVAPSSGINVWCAAAGGHFSTHSVVTALKTSGITDRVRHRTAILPQLAATGVLSRDVRKRTGWRVEFGPVSIQDIPEYLENGRHVTETMRHVLFPRRDRLEMAIAWAAPTSIVAGPALGVVHVSWGLLAAGLAWAFAFVAFFCLDRLGTHRRVIFLTSALAVAAVSAAFALQTLTSTLVFACLGPILAAIVTADYSGSTPIEDVTHFDESAFRIALDSEKCVGVYRCDAVCPEDVFNRIVETRKVSIARPERCIRCAACIVQCPADALYLEDSSGRRVEPEFIRTYKLNLLGKRSVS
jgi:NAD-dependent dihydropyrimidine dehydrogenase PreA subunit